MKKVVHHFNRTLVKSLEVAGILALVLFLAWLGLIWRLSQGPLNVDSFLTGKLETAFHRDNPDFKFKLGTTQLIWGGRLNPFEVEVQDVGISRTDDTPVLDVKKLRVQLSKRNLVFGRIVPRVVRVFGPSLRVIRHADGHFGLNVGGEDDEELALPDDAKPEVEETRQQLVKGVLLQLQERKGLGLLDGLREVDIHDARLLYDDRVLGVRWRSRRSDVSVRRGQQGIEATALVSIDLDANTRSALKAGVSYDWNTQKTSASLAFAGVNPSRIAQQSPHLKELTEIDAALDGSFAFSLDRDFLPVTARFALGSKEGTFNAFGLYESPISFKSFFSRGEFDMITGKGGLHEMKVDIGGPVAQLTASVETRESGVRDIRLQGELTDMPMDSLGQYWPHSLAPDPREWVVASLTKGIATKATIEMAGAYDGTAEEKPFTLEKLGGNIDFHGIKVDYFPPLEPAYEAKGKAYYDAKSFHLDISGGKLKDMKVTKSTIHITELDRIAEGKHSNIDIAVSLAGPLRTALQVLDSKPLGYPTMLGIKSGEVKGNAEVDVKFKFPIHHALAVNDVHVEAEAKLKDVLLKDVVAGMDLAGGPMDLSVSNAALKIKGKGKLADMPVTFDWFKTFDEKEKVTSTLSAGLALDAPALAAFGLPEYMDLDGKVPSEVKYVLRNNGSAELDLVGDIGPLGFSVPDISWTKKGGAPGSLGLTLHLKDNKPQRITGLDLKTGGAVVKGDLEFGAVTKESTGIKKASLSTFTFGKTDVSIEAADKGAAGYDVKVSGRQIDASSVFDSDAKANSDAEAARRVTPLSLRFNVARLLTADDKSLMNVRGRMERNEWQRIDHLELEAKAGKSDVSLRYLPVKSGHSLDFVAEDAGLALSALGITNSIQGGRLKVEGRPRVQGGPRDLGGSAILTDFKLINAPVVAKLLNSMSLIGMLQMMNDNGISFTKARVDFSWTDKGMPDQRENMRLIRLANGKTYGASLGLAFEGEIDNWKNVYDLKGTIVPISGLSKVIGAIPILGTIVTAGGEGIIGATYTIKGPKDEPVVSVNPLSALAPGILRKMFFEN